MVRIAAATIYDCVPNYWDGPLGVGYASLVYEAYQLMKSKLGGPPSQWSRLTGVGEPLRLIQCAEQLVAAKLEIGAVSDGSSRAGMCPGSPSFRHGAPFVRGGVARTPRMPVHETPVSGRRTTPHPLARGWGRTLAAANGLRWTIEL